MPWSSKAVLKSCVSHCLWNSGTLAQAFMIPSLLIFACLQNIRACLMMWLRSLARSRCNLAHLGLSCTFCHCVTNLTKHFLSGWLWAEKPFSEISIYARFSQMVFVFPHRGAFHETSVSRHLFKYKAWGFLWDPSAVGPIVLVGSFKFIYIPFLDSCIRSMFLSYLFPLLQNWGKW